jgi:DNA polymerase I-like protein with 3'-5' exonuclease and polymerase domains
MTSWCPPTELPDLRRAGPLALDLETKDEGLLARRGSAWPWCGGHICGLSVAWHEGNAVRSHYIPIRHPDGANFDPEQVYQWVRDLVGAGVRFITQNGIYDWGWLRSEAGIKMPPSERLEEIGAIATLVDENRFNYSLDSLCAWRAIPGKDEALLREGAEAAGFPKKAKLQTLIWQLPARYVGPYAETDAASTFGLFKSLNPVLDQEGTRTAYRLEVDLLPMVLEMRRRGVRIDQVAAERERDQLLQKRDAVFAEISEELGTNVGMAEIGRNKWLATTFDAQGIAYPRTKKANPSFTAGTTGWMHKHPHWLPRLIVKADKYNNAATKFLETYILGHVVNGRIHAEVHPHRSDAGGTRSLRFSYSNPPLQQTTSHDEELAPLIRGVFLPEEGEVWASADISQQEFRFIVHYAALRNLKRADEAVARYCSDPNADFHAMVADMTGLARQSAKNTNFAKAFGAGVRKFAAMIDQSEKEARALYNQYDRELPFVVRLSALCQASAAKLGYTELYDGARRHWGYEVVGIPWTKDTAPCTPAEAERRLRDPEHPWFGLKHRLRRAETHKALNGLIQGSAARHTKLWMRACWREGLVPLLQMHDALDCSVTSREQGELVAQLGREAVKLEVPIQVDLKFGWNWGDAKHRWEELGHSPPPPQAATPQPIPPQPESPKINGTKVPAAAAPGAIELPEEVGARVPLSDLIDERLINGKVCCPFHEDATPSCHIYPDHFYCFGCGAHGDAIDWLMRVDGLDYAEACETLRTWSGPRARQHAEGDTLASALRLWEAARPLAGTLAAQYLTNRHIDVDALPANVGDVLRFHRNCPFGKGVRHPCLIALFRDVTTDAPAGIHRIALTEDAQKIERLMLGRWPPPRAIKLWPAESSLVIGEGIETTLAAATRVLHHGAPLRPAWAIGSSGGIARLPLVKGVERLTILVDNDPAGRSDARAYARQWAAAGCTATLLTPRQPGADFNDIARELLQ